MMQSGRMAAWAMGSVLAWSGAALGATVYTETFSGQSEGSVPQSGSTSWYTLNDARISASTGNPLPALRLVDTLTTSGTDARAELNLGVSSFSSFDMSTPQHAVVTIGFDLRVDDFYVGSTHGATPRFVVKDESTNFFVFGFGNADTDDGDAAFDYHMYAGGSSSWALSNTKTLGTPIGLEAATGWKSGFNFGNYNATSKPTGNTLDRFYRINLTFTAGSQNVVVDAMQLNAAGEPTLNKSTTVVNAGRTFSLSKGPSDGIGVYTGSAAVGTVHIDNIIVTSGPVPEPAAVGLAAFAGAGMLLRRRRG